MKITPMDAWTREILGESTLDEWQLDKFRETLAWSQNSPFYRERLSGHQVDSLEDIRRLPFMSDKDIIGDDKQFLCVSPKEIQRIVTLWSTGTTDTPKRIHFTAEDHELTVDFFARGLPLLADAGTTMAILIPGDRPGSVGDLIAKALVRIPVTPLIHGPVLNLQPALDMLMESGAQSMVGLPHHILALARYSKIKNVKTNIKKALLTADNVPETVADEVAELGWEPYRHYGMTEMGLGGAIDCDAHAGQHIRESDLYVEIIDPDTGALLPDGEFGEVVFSSLTRKGMPLIRYRTGDRSRIIPGVCPCGCPLRRLDVVRGKFRDVIDLGGGNILAMRDLDEKLFALPQLMDFSVKRAEKNGNTALEVAATAFSQLPALTREDVLSALQAVEALKRAPNLDIDVAISYHDDIRYLHGAKRLFRTA